MEPIGEPGIILEGTRGVRVFLRVLEPRGDVPIRAITLVVHGLGSHGERSQVLAQAMADLGYVVLLPDLRGHGRSGGPRGHVECFDDYLDDVRMVLDRGRQLHPGLPLVLAGHSLGGLIVINHVLRGDHGAVSLMLSSPFLGNRFGIGRLEWSINEVLHRLFPRLRFAGRGWEVGPSNDPLTHRLITSRAVHEVLTTAAKTVERGSEIDIPCLLLIGELDPVASPAKMARFGTLAGAEVHRFSELGHVLLEGRLLDQAARAAVAGFLANQLPST